MNKAKQKSGIHLRNKIGISIKACLSLGFTSYYLIESIWPINLSLVQE